MERTSPRVCLAALIGDQIRFDWNKEQKGDKRSRGISCNLEKGEVKEWYRMKGRTMMRLKKWKVDG